MSHKIDKGRSEWSRRHFVKAGGAALALSSAGVVAQTPAPRVMARVAERRDELIALLSDMVRIRSQSGESAEEAQGLVKDYLSQLPYRIEESADRPSDFTDHAEFMPPNPPGDGPFVNVVGHPQAGSRYALFSHIDTHPVDEGWETDPYKPVLRGRRLYGLGTGDDKGGVAAMLVAAAVLNEMGGPLPVVMSLHGKGGGSRGSLPVFERFRQSGADIDAVLYVHPAETGRGLDDVKNEVQGVLDLELTVKGWRAPPMEIGSVDSSSWEDGGNALDVCDAALDDLRATVFAGIPFNLGTVRGGDRVGSVADSASAGFRIKFSGNASWRGLLQAARDRLALFSRQLPERQPGFALSLAPIGYRTNPGKADWDAPVSRVLRASIEDIVGKAPAAYPNHYAGDIRYPIRLLGVPAYGIGSLGGGFYGPNEWVDVDDLLRLAAVIVHTLGGWSEL